MEESALATIISTFAKCLYDDSKKSLKSISANTFAPINIKNYLEKEEHHYRYIKNMLFGSDRVNFDETYQRHKIHINNQKIADYTLQSLFAKNPQVCLIGEAGIGKSTFVQYLFRESIQKKFKIPVLIELRTLKENKNLEDIVYEKLSIADDLIPIDFVKDQLKKGKFIIFFDGYDEVGDDQIEYVNNLLNNTCKKYGKNSSVLTSRPYANAEYLTSFTPCRLCSFEMEDVQDFITKISKNFEFEFIRNLREAVKSDKPEHIEEFLSNPLLLSLFIITYSQNSSEIPNQLSSFYSNVTDALFSKHDTVSKNSFHRRLKTQIDREQFKSTLFKFSFLSTMEYSYSFNQDKLDEYFKKIKGKYNLNFDNSAFTQDMTKSLALWILDGGEYRFSHRSLQEYYFAKSVSLFTEKQKSLFYHQLMTNFTSHSNVGFRGISLKLRLLHELDKNFFEHHFILPFYKDLKNAISRGKDQRIKNYLSKVLLCNHIDLDYEEESMTCRLFFLLSNNKGMLRINISRLDRRIAILFRDIEEKLEHYLIDYFKKQNLLTKRLRFNLGNKSDFDTIFKILKESNFLLDIIAFHNSLTIELGRIESESLTNEHDKILELL